MNSTDYGSLVKSPFRTFYSAGNGFPFPAICSEFKWFHPLLRTELIRFRPVDGLLGDPSIMIALS